MANFIPHKTFRELSTSSKIIYELDSNEGVNNKIISIIPEFDNHVWAERGSFLPKARENFIVDVKGHHKAVFDKNVINKVLEWIEKLS